MKIAIEEKRFGDKIIFKNRTFIFPDHKRSALIAESGRGKTTLMRMLSLLDKDFIGTIDNPPEKPVVLFQEDRLSESISALSNLMAVTDNSDEALSMLGKVGLSGEERTKVHALSGGMKRRLAIARALLVPFDVLFLDEPFTGLDYDTKVMVSSLILERTLDRTLIFITHSSEDVDLLSPDSVVEID